jgi:hypothetical protein
LARPKKEGLDYFPLDIGLDQDDKLVVPIAKYGMQGLGVIIKIMSEIYKNGYYYPWGEREQYVFANRVNVDINTIIGLVNECIKWGFFNQELYEKHQILTSKGFQSRYLEAAKRRKEITMIDTYVLVDLEKMSEKLGLRISVVNSEETVVNVYINPSKSDVTDTENTQSKVKESKEESKEKELKDKNNSPPKSPKGESVSDKIQYADFVFLTQDEHEKLSELLGDEERDRFFLEYASWISGQTARIQKTRSAYLTILNWHRREQKNPKPARGQPQQSKWGQKVSKLQMLYEEARASEEN